jgi:DNA glycosylase AlkZ-like
LPGEVAEVADPPHEAIWMLAPRLKLSWTRAAAWRVRQHHLDRRAPAGSMVAVASRLCGLHAQIMSSAELMCWARVEDLDRGAVQRALWEERTLVKTWAMRGTLHARLGEMRGAGRS